MRVWADLALAGVLLLVSAAFVVAEFGLVRVRRTRLEELARDGSRRAALALRLVTRLDLTLATTQVGITLANLGIGWLGEPAVAHLLDPLFTAVGLTRYLKAFSFGVGFLLITLVTVILGELVPKAIGIQRAETVVLTSARPLRAARWLIFPLVALTNMSARAVLRLAGLPAAFESDSAHTEEELRLLLASSQDRGQISRVDRDIVDRVLGFSRLNARQLMVPRPDVTWLSTTDPPEKTLESARNSGYTRFPVCEGDLDRVVGVVHIKDLPGAGSGLAGVMRPPILVPETARADRLLRLFQRERLHLAIVVDEYGGTSGIVTLEDVLEEIVGEVQDEFDQEPPEIQKIAEGRYRVEGRARFAEVARALGEEADAETAEVDTVGGFVQQRLGRVAREGDEVRLGAYALRVDEVRRNRVVRLIASSVTPSGQPGEARGGSGGREP